MPGPIWYGNLPSVMMQYINAYGADEGLNKWKIDLTEAFNTDKLGMPTVIVKSP